jgi:dipeptidyl aminopeptidase/acylaminoacyl peptidase
MSRTLTLIGLVLLLPPLASAQKKSTLAGLPVLIDRELLFGNPEITGSQLSPDGKFIAFMKPWKGVINIWVKKTAEPFASAKLLTTETKRPIPGYLWSRDGKYIAYVKDFEGDENFNVYAVEAAASPADGSEAPPSRDMTGLKGVQVQLYSVPKNDPDVLYIGLNDRDKAWHDLYKLNLSTGQRTLIRKNTERIASWFFDLKGQLRLAFRIANNGDQEILRADSDSFTKVYSCSVFESCVPMRFQKDGKRAYLQTNKGDATDLTGLALLDPAAGTVEAVESDPLKRVDFGGAMFSEVTDELAMTSYTDDRTRRYFKDKEFEKDYAWLRKQLSGKEVGIGSRTLNERMWLVTGFSDTEPGEIYLFDRGARKLMLQYRVREQLPREALSPMRAVRYKSVDGLEIPAYITYPKGMPATGLPMIVIPHGGPWARDAWGFNPLAQFFANRGYAVLMANFRGSTGYGKKFLNAGNGEWGRKMQDDITWGVNYATSAGIADPKRVGILGGSYGGYATLAGVAFTPDVYRAAVDIVGPANLITLLEAIPPYWEAIRKVMYTRMADPGTEAGKAWLRERSPLHAAAKIKTPLMVVQGANDPRVNRGEAEQIVTALRDRGFTVEYLMAPDEGHGFARPVNNMAMFMAVEKFLSKHLDGRYQEGGKPEVVQRLAEISVDPKTVVVSRKTDAKTAGTPKPASDLAPAEYRYQAKLAAGGQERQMKLSTSIKEEGGAWVVTDTMETPMGPATDTVTLEKGSLLLRNRAVKQGQATITLAYGDGKLKGTMSINGQERPISADLDGPLFADAAGAHQSIGRLPLADGYSATYRNFDLQKQKVKVMQLKVAGQESITVPAGTFDSFRVEVTSADGGAEKTTLWIAKDSREPVKVSAVMPQMGGAVLTAELMK